MFTYRCLRCGKQHTDERSFTEAFEARCLRCGNTFTVTPELAHTAPEGNGTAARSQAITAQPAARGNGTVRVGAADTQMMRSDAVTTLSPVVHRAELVEEPSDTAPPEEEAQEESVPAEEAEGSTPAPPRTGPALRDMPSRPLNPSEAAEQAAGKKKMLVLATSIGVPILLLCALGAFFLLNRSPKKEVAKTKTTPKKKETAKKAPAPAPKKEEPKKVSPPAPSPQVAAYRFSAAALSAQLADDAKQANDTYKDKVLEVSGILERITGGPTQGVGVALPAKGPNAPAAPPPAQAVFRTERNPVSCDMATLTGEAYRRQALKPGLPFTVRGTYRKDGLLQNCLLLDPTPTADAKYFGKTLEVIGTVDSAGTFQMQGEDFPSITLEGETNSTIIIRCLFAKGWLDQVRRVPRGEVIGIRGMCSGRRLEKDHYEVRIDNCQLVETTVRDSTIDRIIVGLGRIRAMDLARAYEEDLRPYYLPPRGKELRIETPLSVSDLSKGWKTDRDSLTKYRLRIVTVSAVASRRQPPNRLVLEPAETDQPLRVSCLFDSKTYARLGAGPAFQVTGLCMGMEKDGVLRLDNCEVDPSQLRWEGPTLTADYFPHKEGTVQVYDMAIYPPVVKTAGIERQVWYQRADGGTETVITHRLKGLPSGGSLFTDGKASSWANQPGARKLKIPERGTAYAQRITTTGFLEAGRRLPAPGRGQSQVVYEPVMKLGAKPGDSWKWTLQNDDHVYTLVRFDKHADRRAAIIQEDVVNTITGERTRAIQHVLVEGVGEIERREWMVITSKEKKIVAEKKLVKSEQLPVGPAKTK